MSSFRRDLKTPLSEKVLNCTLVLLATCALVFLVAFVAK